MSCCVCELLLALFTGEWKSNEKEETDKRTKKSVKASWFAVNSAAVTTKIYIPGVSVSGDPSCLLTRRLFKMRELTPLQVLDSYLQAESLARVCPPGKFCPWRLEIQQN